MSWTVLFELLVVVLGFVLKKAIVSQSTAENYFDWVEKASKDTKSTKLAEYGKKQVDWLKNNPWPEA